MGLLFCLAAVAPIIWPADDHLGDLEFMSDGKPVARCALIVIKAPEVDGKKLWLAYGVDGDHNVLQPASRKERTSEDKYFWRNYITLGNETSNDTSYQVEAFYLSRQESDYLNGVSHLAVVDDKQDEPAFKKLKSLHTFGSSKILPAEAQDHFVQLPLTRSSGMSSARCEEE